MVSVAQLVEPRIVIPVVAGSNPVVHPNSLPYFDSGCLAVSSSCAPSDVFLVNLILFSVPRLCAFSGVEFLYGVGFLALPSWFANIARLSRLPSVKYKSMFQPDGWV